MVVYCNAKVFNWEEGIIGILMSLKDEESSSR